MLRRSFLKSVSTAGAVAIAGQAAGAQGRDWPLGINTYCLRFQKWTDRQLFDYCNARKLDAIFLQDSLDAGVMNPAHWTEVRGWAEQSKMRLETGGGSILPPTRAQIPESVATLQKNMERAKAMGSPVVRINLISDRYHMPVGPVEQHVETAITILRQVRSRAMDAGLKIALENHKDIQAWRTRQLIETAGKEFVGSYLDTGNPVFVAEHPMTTVEELGPVAVSFHLRDSVVYSHPDGVAVQWVPLGEGSVDFKAILARAAEVMPPVYVYCKPITARPPVVLPVYTEEFWTKWFPGGRSNDFARFLTLARTGRPWDKPHVMEDLPETRERFIDALRIQQLDHMEQSLQYCRDVLGLGRRWRA